MTDYGFFFEELRNGMPEGISDSGEETFRGSADKMANALVRELAQNSLDAKIGSNDDPVRMVFELRTIRTQDLPDYDNLRAHIESADQDNSDDPSNTRLKNAVSAIRQDEIPVLRVSDYNTKGLSGNEKEKGSTLRALTYYSGKSADKRGSGGSYGIGKAVGIATSSVRTELWTTMAAKSKEVVFTGYSRLATHSDPSNKSVDLMASGIYTDKSVIKSEGLHYRRDLNGICGFPRREEPGTDLYILGYLMSDDSKLENLSNALINNFMVAIHRGRLVVEGVWDGGSWTLDSSTLPGMIESDKQKAFYDALLEKPIIKDGDKYLGQMKLYVNMDRELSERYGIYGVRKPLMRVHDFDIRAVRMNFAAIFECSSDEGNDILRTMEPPSHDKWEKRPEVPDAQATMRHATDFIKDTLKSMQEEKYGDKIEIPGLNLLLPSNEVTAFSAPSAHRRGGSTSEGQDQEEEAPKVHGKDSDDTPVFDRRQDKAKAVITRPAVSQDEGLDALKGKNQGGDGKRGKHAAGIQGHAAAGDGYAEIHSAQVAMRTLYHAEDQSYTLILRARDQKPISGFIRLTATLDGRVDPSFVLPIESAEDLTSGTSMPLPLLDGKVIKNVNLSGNKPTKIRVKISGGRKMQLAVI